MVNDSAVPLCMFLLFSFGIGALLLAGGALLTLLRLSREFTLSVRDLAEFIKAESLQEKVQLDEARKPQPEPEPLQPVATPTSTDDLVRQLLETGRPVTDVDGHEWEMT